MVILNKEIFDMAEQKPGLSKYLIRVYKGKIPFIALLQTKNKYIYAKGLERISTHSIKPGIHKK